MNDIMAPRRPAAKPTPKPIKPQLPPPPGPEEPEPLEPKGPIDLPPVQKDTEVKPPKKRSLKWLWITLAVLFTLVLAGAGAGYWWYQDNLQAKSDSSQRIPLKIESGDSVEAVTNKLEQAGIIRNALVMLAYMKVNGLNNIKTGSYLFAPNQTPQEIAAWLVEGRVDTFKVTILPGQSVDKIKKGLVSAGYDQKEVDAAFKKTYKHALLAKKPTKASLEGYVYPETYFVTSDTSVEQLLVVTFDEFEKQLEKTDIVKTLTARKMSLHQGIILASIIEREVVRKDQRQVSQVFHKRLETGMTLGADATYHYAAALLGVDPSPSIKSPYNTRIHTGLPPGPIANFPITALEATAHPASGSYLYFVSGDDGNTYFAHTFAEHEANISKYCQKLCSRN